MFQHAGDSRQLCPPNKYRTYESLKNAVPVGRFVTAVKDVEARWRQAMTVMGLGLATSGFGLAWDYYVHEIVREVHTVESIFAAPHIPIFVGIMITGLGFLWALAGLRISSRAKPT
jgi:hypothetical protein